MQVYNAYNYTVSGSTQSAGKSSVDKDGFLRILSAQLQNQDPMAGGDNTQYVAQMAQFTSLEQMTNLYDVMSQVLISQKFQEGNLMIGKVAKINLGEGQYLTGEVTGTRIANGAIKILIDDNEYYIDQVEELTNKGSVQSVL